MTTSFCVFHEVSCDSSEAGGWFGRMEVRCKEAISYRGPLLDVCSEIGKFSYNLQFVYGVDTAVAFIF